MKSVGIKKRILSLILTLSMILPSISNIPAVYAAEDVDYNKNISISIGWQETEDDSLSVYCDSQNVRNISQRVTYKSTNVDADYEAGELRIVVKGMKDLYRNGKLEAVVGADKESSSVKDRDWSYTYNRANNEYIFTNNNKISKGSTLDGFFDLVYPVYPKEAKNGFSQSGINATLYYPDGTMNKSNDLSISIETERSVYTVSIEQGSTYSGSGLSGYVDDVNNYILLKYQLGYTFIEKARNLENRKFTLTLPDNFVVCYNNIDATYSGEHGNSYQVDLSLWDNDFVYVAVPKTYLGQTVTATISLDGNYYDESEQTSFSDSVEIPLPEDFYYSTLPGDCSHYNFELACPDPEGYGYEPIKSSEIQSQNGGENKYTLYVDYFKNDDKKYEMEVVADNSFITKPDGNFRLLSLDEYNIESIDVGKAANDTGDTISTGDFEIYACSSNVFQKETLIASGKLSEMAGTYEMPEGTHSVGIVYTNLTETMSNTVQVRANVHNVGDDIMVNNGHISNVGYARFFRLNETEDGQVEKVDLTTKSYAHIEGVDVEAMDLQNYGDVVLTRYNDYDTIVESYNYMSSKSSLDEFTFKDIYNIYTTANMETKFDFDAEAPHDFSVYTVLPEGLSLKGVDNVNDIFDQVTMEYSGGQSISSAYLIQNCEPEIIHDYQGSGRTYVAFHFHVDGLDKEFKLNIHMGLSLDYNYIENGGYSANLQCYLYEDSGAKLHKTNLLKDDGTAQGGEIYKDINQNGSTEDLVAVSSCVRPFVYPMSGQFSIKKTVKGSNDGNYGENTITEIGKGYTYLLEIQNGSSELKDIVLTDDIESAGNYKGEYKDISFSNGFSGSYDPDSGKITINESIDSTQQLKVYIKMAIPNDKTAIGKELKNNFSFSGTMVTDLDSQHVEVESNTTNVEVVNRLGDISIRKTDAENGSYIDGATFEIYKASNDGSKGDLIDTKTTNYSGYANFKNLDYGYDYIVVETSAPKGYQKLDQEIKVTLDEDVKTVKVENSRLDGSILVEKFNNLDNSVKVEGAEYELFKIDKNDQGEDVRTSIGTYVTDKKGNFKVDGLKWGNYELEETKAPMGYIKSDEVYSFSVGRENVNETIAINLTDNQDEVLVTLQKFQKGINGSETDQTLQGATFELYRIKPDTNGDYELLEENLIGEFVTNENGEIKVNEIPYGDYVFKEAVAPAGYEKCENITFTLSPDIKDVTLKAYDQQKPGTIAVQKMDSNQNIVTDAGFTLYDANMSPIFKDAMVDGQGSLVFENLEWGKYYLKETVAPKGYELDETVHEIDIRSTHLTERVQVVNQEILGKILLEKVDRDTDVALPGAEFNLCKNDGTVVAQLVTNENGQAKYDGLEWGTYYLEETKAPDGYQIDSTKHKFVVNYQNAGVEQKIQIENAVDSNRQVTITKTVNPDDYWGAHGDEVFIFNLKYQNAAGETVERNVSIKFDEGESSKSAIVDKIPANVDKVLVSEYSINRYDMTEVTDGGGNPLTLDQTEKAYALTLDGNDDEIIFKNEKTDWSGYSDASSVINTISKQRKLVALEVNFNHEGFVNAMDPINRDELDVTVYYDDGESYKLANDQYQLDAEKWPNKGGDFLVNVTYEGLTGSFIGTVDPDSILESPTMKNLNNSSVFEDLNVDKSTIETVTFTSRKVPDGVQYANVGFTSKDDVVAWVEGANLYISNQNPRLTIKLPKDSSDFFRNYSNLQYINDDIGIDTENVTDISYMFFKCPNLINIDVLASWDVSKVTTIRSIFADCSKLSDIPALANWDVSRVTNFASAFEGTSINGLESLIDWNMSNATNIIHMFDGCTNISDLTPLANWDISNVTSMMYIFNGCSNIDSLDPLANWKVGKVTSLSHAFAECSKITNVDALANWDISNVTNLGDIFSSCSKLSDISALANWNVSKVTDITRLLFCTAISNVSDLRKWNTSNFTTISSAFYGCGRLVDISGLINWDVSNVTYMTSLFSECTRLSNISVLSNWKPSDKLTDIAYLFNKCVKIQDISAIANWNVSNVNNVKYSFAYTGIQTLDSLSNWKLNLTDIKGAFKQCKSLTDISVLANWDVSDVTNLSEVFWSCPIEELSPLKGWDVSKVTTMNSLFNSCVLKDISALANWNTSSLTNVDYLFVSNDFTDVSALANWDVSKVTSFYTTFNMCYNLEDISGLANWDVGSAKTFYSMFRNCQSLTNLNPLANWNMSSATGLSGMFEGSINISDLTPLKDWDVSNVDRMADMFNGCSNLDDATCLENWAVKADCEIGRAHV